MTQNDPLGTQRTGGSGCSPSVIGLVRRGGGNMSRRTEERGGEKEEGREKKWKYWKIRAGKEVNRKKMERNRRSVREEKSGE